MKSKRFFVKAELLHHESLSELDFDLMSDICSNEEEEDNWDLVYTKGYGRADGYPIRIDRMIEILKGIKEKSDDITHVSIEHHSDHYGYLIDGYQIVPMTEMGIKDHLEKESKNDAKLGAILKLKAEIKKIEESE